MQKDSDPNSKDLVIGILVTALFIVLVSFIVGYGFLAAYKYFPLTIYQGDKKFSSGQSLILMLFSIILLLNRTDYSTRQPLSDTFLGPSVLPVPDNSNRHPRFLGRIFYSDNYELSTCFAAIFH